MQKQPSLVELATYGYAPTRVREGSWLQRTFGTKNKEVDKNEHIERSDKDQIERAGR